jgi:uncharacterized protein YndB with AHSA1/START domain
MTFQDDPGVISWRLHLQSPPSAVYAMLATAEGRARFWAESAEARDNAIHFLFPDGQRWQAQIIDEQPPYRFTLVYFGGSLTTFELADDGMGGTDLTLTDAGVRTEDRTEVIAGWVSVLLALKAAVDFGVDLRNHDATRTWDNGFVDN